MITFEQFKKEQREKEASEGYRQIVQNRQIVSRGPLTDEELFEMWKASQVDEPRTGVTHHGEIIGGKHVLTLELPTQSPRP